MFPPSDAIALKLLEARYHGTPQYKHAIAAGFHPTQLSAWLHGAILLAHDDQRVARLGQALGLNMVQ